MEFKWPTRLPIFPLMIGVSLGVGLLIPAFYDWTGSDQSRPSPLIFQSAVAVLLCGIITCSILPWLKLAYDPPTNIPYRKFQFKIRSILMFTAVVAVFLVAFNKLPVIAVSGGLYGLALCFVTRYCILFRAFRWPLASLFACMYFPFAWIASWDELTQAPEMIWMASGLPTLILAIPIGRLFQQHAQDSAWLSILMAGAELVIGVWLIRLGPKRFVAYLVFVLMVSVFSSFILNALARI